MKELDNWGCLEIPHRRFQQRCQCNTDLNSGVILEPPPELRDRALTDTEGYDEDDDDDDPFPPLAPTPEGSAGCFAHLLNLIVEVYTYLNAFINIVYFTMLIHTLIHVNIMAADSMIVVTSNCF